MPNDNLQIELVVEDGKAAVALDRFKGNLAAAEVDASRLGTAGSAAFQKLGGGAAAAIPPLRLAKGQAQQLSFQINDMATMLAVGASPFQVMASQGGQVIQVFGGLNGTLAATRSALAAINVSFAGLAVAGGVAAAGFALVKITQHIREEAERRLKLEEMITGAMNKQRLLSMEIAANLTKTLEGDSRDRDFSRLLKEGSKEELQQRFDAIKRIQDIGGNTDVVKGKNGQFEQVESEASKRRTQQLRDLQAQIDTLNKGASGSLDQRWENYKRFAESAAKAEAERAAKFAASVKAGIEKVEELGKVYRQTFRDLTLQARSDNPFVQLFLSAEDALEKLKENIRGLPAEMQAAAIKSQQAIQNARLFEARLTSSLNAFGLRGEAANFRNPFDENKNKRDQDAIIGRFLADNPNYEFLRGNSRDKNGTLTDAARRDILSRSQAGRDSLETPADRLNKTLEKQLELIYGNARTPEEMRIADRKFAQATQGANPLELSQKVRDAAATARERLADAEEASEKEAIEATKELTAINKKLLEQRERMIEAAKKGGKEAIEILVKDETAAGVTPTRNPSRPSNADTQNQYSGGLTF